MIDLSKESDLSPNLHEDASFSISAASTIKPRNKRLPPTRKNSSLKSLINKLDNKSLGTKKLDNMKQGPAEETLQLDMLAVTTDQSIS